MPYYQVDKSTYFQTAHVIDLETAMYHEASTFEAKSKAYNASTAVPLASPAVGTARAFLDAGGKTLMKAWLILAVRTEAHKDAGRAVVIRGGGGDPDAVRRSWEAEAQTAVARMDPATGAWALHVCDAAGCGKQTGGREYAAVVMDGVEKLTFHACAEFGCKNDPVHAQARFCAAHKALETQCAAFVDPPQGAPPGATGAFCPNAALPKRRCCSDPAHVALEDEYGGSGSRLMRRRMPDETMNEYRLAQARWCALTARLTGAPQRAPCGAGVS